jgi:hypothetical protein
MKEEKALGRHSHHIRALKTFGINPKTSLVASTSITSKARNTTSVKPESCNNERRKSSGKT